MQRERRTPEPNGVARAFWDEVRAGILPDGDDGGRRKIRRRATVRELKVRRQAHRRR
jgi:hypothetical protein